jgi:hypothetical protein
MFKWFSSTESVRFGGELATFVLAELAAANVKQQAKFAAKAEKALLRADQRLQEFKAREGLNVYKKAKLANAFLWMLRDKGCSPDYAKQLTDWLSTRM